MHYLMQLFEGFFPLDYKLLVWKLQWDFYIARIFLLKVNYKLYYKFPFCSSVIVTSFSFALPLAKFSSFTFSYSRVRFFSTKT